MHLRLNKKYLAKLNSIYYDEEKAKEEIEQLKNKYNVNKDEIIILYSNFTTYSEEELGDSGFDENVNYAYSWVLIKNDNKNWTIK